MAEAAWLRSSGVDSTAEAMPAQGSCPTSPQLALGHGASATGHPQGWACDFWRIPLTGVMTNLTRWRLETAL